MGDVEKAVETYKKQGFVVLENVFDEETMNQMTNILNSWRKVGKWEDFTWSKFVYDEHLPTNANRFEVILPYHEPFSILYYKLHNALKDVMGQLGKPKLKSFSAYGSLPGAIESTYQKLKMSDPNMLKASIILQPQIHERVLCPCTHQNSHLFSFFTYNASCPIQYDSFKAGSVVLFDPLLKYFETDHEGSFVRWNVDALYVFGEVELLDYLEGDDAMAVQKKKKNVKHVEKYHTEYL